MKKYIITSLLLLLPIASNAVDPVPTVRNYYVMPEIIQSNLSVPVTDASGTSDMDFNLWGLGVAFGTYANSNISLELEGMFMGIGITSPLESDSMNNFSLVAGARFGEKFFGFLYPYVGVGAGLSVWVNHISYNAFVTSGSDTLTRLNFTYQAKAGLILTVSERFDLDFGVKYQNMGRPDNKIPVFDITDDIMNLEFHAGVAYKF